MRIPSQMTFFGRMQIERVMYLFMCRVAQPVASRQGSVAQPWLVAKASRGPQAEKPFRRRRAPRRAAARSGCAVGQSLLGAGATRREGRLRARSGVAHLAKVTSLGRGARLGSGPQTTFAAHEKVHNTL